MSRPKVTIINCTNRQGGIDTLLHSLKRQSFQDFECLIMDERHDWRHKEVLDYFNVEWPGSYGDKIKHLKPLPKKKGNFWNLDYSFNQALCYARGEYIVTLQDYVYMEPDGIQMFVDKMDELGPCLVTGVGHKGKFPEWAPQLQGKITIFQNDEFSEEEAIRYNKPELGIQKPTGMYHRDPRMIGAGFRPSQPIEWEANYGITTKAIFEELGGFDEDFDKGWGYDNTNFAERAQAAGYEMWLDEDNVHIGFSHELLFGELELKNRAPNNQDVWRDKIERIKKDDRSAIYLDWINKAREDLKLGVLT